MWVLMSRAFFSDSEPSNWQYFFLILDHPISDSETTYWQYSLLPSFGRHSSLFPGPPFGSIPFFYSGPSCQQHSFLILGPPVGGIPMIMGPSVVSIPF